MKRTCITLSAELERRAKETARRRGVSFAELVRQTLETELARDPGEHLFFDMNETWDGPSPGDGARKHDDYLYGPRKRGTGRTRHRGK